MKLFFSVGEPSGDLHGANLIRALKQRVPDCECIGFGGPQMSAAGFTLHEDLTRLAVMWFLRALLNLHRFVQLLLRADRCFRDDRPDAVVLIDYPGFNWWVARRAKARGIPVFYYGAPQMWAWAPWRIHKMRRLVDHVLCKLPFEADWYQARGCNATYVGHPFFDETRRHSMDETFLASASASASAGDAERPLVTLLPGSRTQEVVANLGAFIATAQQLNRQLPRVRYAIAAFNEPQAQFARNQCLRHAIDVPVFVGRTPELIQAATVCLACSGSVSLELLHHRKPTVIHYKISRLAFRLQRYFRTVRFITLVNLLASDDRYCRNGEVYDATQHDVPFPEYLTCDDVSVQMASHLYEWLHNPEAYRATVERLTKLRNEFAVPGASDTAANYIVRQIEASAAQSPSKLATKTSTQPSTNAA